MASATLHITAAIVYRKRPASGKKCDDCGERIYLEEIRPYLLLGTQKPMVIRPFRWCVACREDLVLED